MWYPAVGDDSFDMRHRWRSMAVPRWIRPCEIAGCTASTTPCVAERYAPTRTARERACGFV
jgi:hypothetical protein